MTSWSRPNGRRCSIRLGTVVNGILIGGGKHTGRVQLWAGPNEVAIGGQDAPFRFRLTIGRRASEETAPPSDARGV